MSLDILEIRMEDAIESLISEFSSVRTGKATQIAAAAVIAGSPYLLFPAK